MPNDNSNLSSFSCQRFSPDSQTIQSQSSKNLHSKQLFKGSFNKLKKGKYLPFSKIKGANTMNFTHSIGRETKKMKNWKPLKFVGLGIVVAGLLSFGMIANAAILPVPSASYPTVSAAVAAASPGDTIQVSGDATTPISDNVTVNVPNITIQTSPGASPVIVANVASTHVFEVTVNAVTISGLTISGATAWGKAGIYLNNADNCQIISNTTVQIL